MAYNLIGKQGNFVLRNSDFPQLLRLAIFYGWKPEGTKSPDSLSHAKWDSNEYLNREGQFVCATDANKLGNALKRSLRDIPDYDCKDRDWNMDFHTTRINTENKKQKSLHNLIEYFSGKDKKKIREFIEYAKKGGFKIS